MAWSNSARQSASRSRGVRRVRKASYSTRATIGHKTRRRRRAHSAAVGTRKRRYAARKGHRTRRGGTYTVRY
jgi:hypothetical protein